MCLKKQSQLTWYGQGKNAVKHVLLLSYLLHELSLTRRTHQQTAISNDENLRENKSGSACHSTFNRTCNDKADSNWSTLWWNTIIYPYSLPSGESGNGSRLASCFARGVEVVEDVKWRQGDSKRARLTDIPESSESWLTSIGIEVEFVMFVNTLYIPVV